MHLTSAKENIHDKLVHLNIVDLISQEQLFAMFDYCCDSGTSYETACSSQISSGIMLPSQLHRQGTEVPMALNRSLFRAMHHIGSSANGTSVTPGVSSRTDIETLFETAASLQDAGTIAEEALKIKLLKFPGVYDEKRTVGDQTESFVVDSPVGLELRNWIAREMNADIAVSRFWEKAQ